MTSNTASLFRPVLRGVFSLILGSFSALLLLFLVPPVIAAQSEPLMTPGVRQDTLSQTVCVSGYTHRMRAASAWLRHLKLYLLHERGETVADAHRYQLDHAMPLILGGSSIEPGNYRLQPIGEAMAKDRVERHLGCLVCSGQVSLEQAREAIANDWRAAGEAYSTVRCRRQ